MGLDFLLIGAGFSELLRVLLLHQARFLLFQPDFAGTLTDRIEVLLYRESFLLGFAQRRFGRFQGIARRGQRLFLLRAHRNHLLEFGVERRFVQRAQLLLVSGDAVFHGTDVIGYQLDGVVDFRDLVRAGLQMKRGLLRRALALLYRLALQLQRRLRGGVVLERAGLAALQLDAPPVELADLRLRRVVLRALMSRLRADLGKFRRDLLAALGYALGLLRELEYRQLGIVQRLLLQLGGKPQLVERGLALIELRVRRGEFAALGRQPRLLTGKLASECFDFALARQNPVQFGVRCMKTHAMARKDMAVAGHQQCAGGQPLAQRESFAPVFHDVNLVQPVGQRAGRRCILATDIAGQRREP